MSKDKDEGMTQTQTAMTPREVSEAIAGEIQMQLMGVGAEKQTRVLALSGVEIFMESPWRPFYPANQPGPVVVDEPVGAEDLRAGWRDVMFDIKAGIDLSSGGHVPDIKGIVHRLMKRRFSGGDLQFRLGLIAQMINQIMAQSVGADGMGRIAAALVGDVVASVALGSRRCPQGEDWAECWEGWARLSAGVAEPAVAMISFSIGAPDVALVSGQVPMAIDSTVITIPYDPACCMIEVIAALAIQQARFSSGSCLCSDGSSTGTNSRSPGSAGEN